MVCSLFHVLSFTSWAHPGPWISTYTWNTYTYISGGISCLQRWLISSRGSPSARLCQQVAPVLMHRNVKSGKRSSLDILSCLPALLHVCISWVQASFCAFPERVLWSWIGLLYPHASFSDILYTAQKIFFKVEIQPSYFIFKHVSVSFKAFPSQSCLQGFSSPSSRLSL